MSYFLHHLHLRQWCGINTGLINRPYSPIDARRHSEKKDNDHDIDHDDEIIHSASIINRSNSCRSQNHQHFFRCLFSRTRHTAHDLPYAHSSTFKTLLPFVRLFASVKRQPCNIYEHVLTYY